MKLHDTNIEFQPLNGERYAFFCDEVTALEAVELTHKVLEQLGFEPYDEHFYMGAHGDFFRKSLETITLRGAGQVALIVIPGLSSWVIAGRERVNEVQLLAYLFQLGKQVAGVRSPVIVPVHTIGLDIDRSLLERAFAVCGFKRVCVGYEDIKAEDRKPPLWDEEIEAAVRMSSIAQIAEGIANQPRTCLLKSEPEGILVDENDKGKGPEHEVR